jgi:shikimate dehydrogenase
MTLTAKGRLAGIIGWPVSHSRSPRLHGYWLDKYAIDGAMVPLAVAPDDLELVLKALPLMGFVGANLTLPHKEAAFSLVDEADEAARACGAVNTLVVTGDKRLVGSNTDGWGFIEHLTATAPDWRRGMAVVLGAGGATRGIVYALGRAGVERIRLVNRTLERARRVAAALGEHVTTEIECLDWSARHDALADADLLINATSLGMTGKPPLEIDLQQLPAHAVVADIVYTPLETPLLKTAAAQGHVIVDGLGMLIHQARPGFAAWFGREPEVTRELRDMLSKDLEGRGA